MSRVIKFSDSEKHTSLPLEKEKSFSPLPLAISVTAEERKLSASTLKQARTKEVLRISLITNNKGSHHALRQKLLLRLIA
jgi:hypothetical protein